MAAGLLFAYCRWVMAIVPSVLVRSSSVSPCTVAYRLAHSANSWPGDISPYGQANDRLSCSGTTMSAALSPAPPPARSALPNRPPLDWLSAR